MPFPSGNLPSIFCDVTAFWRGGVLECAFKFSGDWWDAKLLESHPTAGAGRADNLWKSTCLEWFLHPSSGDSYWEANFSPTGAWNLYRLDGYRRGLRPEHRASAPVCRAQRDGADFVVVFSFDLTFLLKELSSVPEWRFAPALVLELNDGSKHYFSLAHTQPSPDFHHPDHRLARLTPEDVP